MSLDQIVFLFVGACIGLGGYFLKRWWESQSVREKIRDLADLAKLKNDMRAGNSSIQALRDLEGEISNRNTARRKDEAAVVKSIENALSSDTQEFRIEDTLHSQAQMNRYAYHLADLAERELDFLIDALEAQLDEDELKKFSKAQRAWRTFARREASFASRIAEGGSMQPMIYSSELRALTIERAAKLKNEVRESYKRNNFEF